jgi:hypothetical protein
MRMHKIYGRPFGKGPLFARSVTIAYRCDAPGSKRFLRVELTPADAGAITIAHSVVREEPHNLRAQP